MMKSLVSCAAIMCVRNESSYICSAIDRLLSTGIDVVVIDNDSDDGTEDFLAQYKQRGLISLHRLPWKGCFDLKAILKKKQELVRSLSQDWIIHIDADEWLQSPIERESLLEGISRMDQLGFNAINFEEFVFLPVNGDCNFSESFSMEMLHYYFFAPQKNRLMRAWKRSDNLSNESAGGHRLDGCSVHCAEENFILRHYIGLSQNHIFKKYIGRSFPDDELSIGWHRNRLNLNEAILEFPSKKRLKCLKNWHCKGFDRTDPKSLHYWHWDK